MNVESGLTFVEIFIVLVAIDDYIEVIHDCIVTGNVFANDYDVFGVLVFVVSNFMITGGTLVLQSNGDYTFTPDPGFTGEVFFTYHLDNGTVQSNQATVTFDVINTVPMAFHGVWRTAHGQTLNVSAERGLGYRSYDRDDDALTWQIVQHPTHGTLTPYADGSFDYVPADPAYTGPDSFVWTVADSIAVSEQQTGWIEITNFIPEASDDELSVHAGTTLTLTAEQGVLRNDHDTDDDVLSALIVTPPTLGTLNLNADGSLDYAPFATTINATDTFTYLINDGAHDSEPATVTISVTNHLPTVYGESYRLLHDQTLTLSAAEGV